MPCANNKGADQTVHPCSLICTFVVHYLESIILILAKSIVSRLYLVCVAEQAGLSLTWSQTLKPGFLMTGLKCIPVIFMSFEPFASFSEPKKPVEGDTSCVLCKTVLNSLDDILEQKSSEV